MRSPVLENLDPDERAAVLAAARSCSFGTGEVVFSAGDPAESVHLVVAGHLAVRVSTRDGDLATLSILGPGAWIGELSLLPGLAPATRSATVLALDPVETLALSRSAFGALCEQHPRVERLVVALMAERIRELSTDLLEARYVGLDRRVASCLHRLVDVYGTDRARAVIPLTQEHLAGLVGAARPRVNEVLQRLVVEQVVELGRGRVVVTDLEALARKLDL
ncbi:MAG: Crp/Fnr family transcriptional regulator [Propionibacteriales bacterium]|nr:Crp/Fnr family transcriptional regulator [Propionibacteriales bacterium]